MKAVLSNKIYIAVTPELKAELISELTYSLIRTGRKGKRIPYKKKDYIEVRDNILAIPVGRTDLIPEDYEIVDKRCAPLATFPPFKLELREDQKVVLDEIDGSVIINAQPSWGKTFCGIALAAKLGYKTLVVVHTLFLLDQWKEEVRKTLGIEPGVLTGTEKNLDSPIVISNVQTLKKHASSLAKEFGTIIVDEGHHTPASTFTEILNNMYCKNRICLSATLGRKDGLGIMLTGYFSHHIIKPKETNRIIPRVLYYDTGVEFSDDNSVPWALRLNDLYNESTYQNIVIELAYAFSHTNKLPTLVVSNRVDFLEHMHEILEEDSILITGNTKNRVELLDRVKSGEIDLIFGTSSIFAEGVNIPRLSVVIPAQPINNATLLEQLAGRVARVHPDKTEAIMVDLRLQGRTGGKQAMSRLKTYASLGYTVDKLPAIP